MRGTTPLNTFNVPIDLRDAEVIYITYKQEDTVVFEKVKDDLTITETSLSVRLTQEETIALKERPVKIQIRARFADGTAVKSVVMTASVDELLKEGVI